MLTSSFTLYVTPLLGAAALGDIGVHFPPSDMAYKGIDSKILSLIHI